MKKKSFLERPRQLDEGLLEQELQLLMRLDEGFLEELQ
uniref:Uncharacterized protein n=1 Tax=viral metagenome TaxID=1070528 RepID=A0A6C0K2Z0_9ZZZZ